MSYRRGREQLPFGEALNRESERLLRERRQLGSEQAFARGPSHCNHSYLERGYYAEQLEGWLEHFPREQLLVLESEHFFSAPAQVHAETTRFLELPEEPLPRYRNVNGWAIRTGSRRFVNGWRRTSRRTTLASRACSVARCGGRGRLWTPRLQIPS